LGQEKISGDALTRIFAVGAALLFASSAAQSAELKVLSGNGSRAAVRELCTQFENTTGHKIDLRFGVNVEVKSKIEAGERFDVVVGNLPIIDALIKDGTVVGPRVDFGQAGLGVAVRSGAPKPDISSVEGFKRALLASNAVAFQARVRAASTLSVCSTEWASRLRCKAS
jgi:molybdate transport system substrate-binding protein